MAIDLKILAKNLRPAIFSLNLASECSFSVVIASSCDRQSRSSDSRAEILASASALLEFASAVFSSRHRFSVLELLTELHDLLLIGGVGLFFLRRLQLKRRLGRF